MSNLVEIHAETAEAERSGHEMSLHFRRVDEAMRPAVQALLRASKHSEVVSVHTSKGQITGLILHEEGPGPNGLRFRVIRVRPGV